MEGGSAGFGIAGDNDAPMAAKGHILGTAFLGLDLQCARCHDSPYHSTKQSDLYALAAMLERKPVIVPKSSRVPAAFFEKKGRESLIKVTLKPDERVKPTWPFGAATGSADGPEIDKLMQAPDDLRERLATLITAPQNERFAQVLANRVWRRLIGAGIVEPVHDWEGMTPSHPELLAWLAHELVTHGYDFRHPERPLFAPPRPSCACCSKWWPALAKASARPSTKARWVACWAVPTAKTYKARCKKSSTSLPTRS